jgi:hypothetical protein
LEKRHTEHHTEALWPEDERDRQADHGHRQQSGGGVHRHLALQGMVRGRDRLHRTLHEDGVEQTECEADAEEDSDHRLAEGGGRRRDQAGEHDAHDEQPQRPESN